MITKRTRALSIIAAVAMLVSMFACFVIPASADASTMQATYDKYNAIANDATEGDELLVEKLAALKEAIDAGDATNEESLTADVVAAAVNLTFDGNAKPRVAWYAEYQAAGYSGKNYSISAVEDWKTVISKYSSFGNFPGYTLYVTDNIDFKGETMGRVPHFYGTLEGQNHAFLNVNIVGAGTNDQNGGWALIGRCANGGGVYDLGMTGTVHNTATVVSETAAFVGYLSGGSFVDNCWSKVHVIADVTAVGSSWGRPAAFVGYANGSTVSNCINLGTIEAGDGNAAAGIVGYSSGGASTYRNCINAGTLLANHTAGFLIHTAHLSDTGAPVNCYSVGSLTANSQSNGGFAASENTLPDGSAFNKDNFNSYYYAATAGEAAYKLNANANGEIYYTLKNGELAFGNAENQVRQIKIVRGDVTTYAYVAPGSVALEDVVPGYADASSVTVKDDVLSTNLKVTDGAFTMPKNNVTITVVDTVKSAKAALAAVEYAAWDKEDLNMFNETNAWWSQVDTLLASGTDVAAILAKAAEIDTILAGALTANASGYAPYSKRAQYGQGSATTFSINSAEDWIQFTEDEITNGTGNCSTKIFVNRDIYFDSDINTYPVNYGGYFLGTIDGQGHAFHGLKIHQEVTSAKTSVALVSYSHSATTIKNLGLVDCSIKGTSVATGSVAGFLGYSNGGGTITNCYVGEGTVIESVNSVIGTSGPFVGGIIGYVNANTVTNCYNIGTVKGTNIAAGIIGGYGTTLTAANNISAGTIIAPNANSRMAGTIIHYNFSSTAPLNSYSVGHTAIAPCNGSTWTNETYASADAYNEALTASSIEEAAYKATDGANSAVYYTIKDGKLAFGTATDRVQKITISRSGATSIEYAVSGEAVDLFAINPALASAESITSSDVEIADGKFTMANKDITITVNDSIESAKAALAAKIEEAWAAKDLNMFEETQEWLADAEDLVANGADASVIVAQVAAIDTILAGELTLDLTAYAPYSKKANYPNNSTTKFSINTANDWIQLTKDYAGKSTGADLELHVNRDIDFNGTPMSPLCYNGTGQAIFYGKIFGNGHTFKNVNITGAPVSHDYIGVGLISAVMSGAAVDGLGLTGNITNTAAGTCAGVFVGARAYGASFTNCWSDVDLVTEGTNTSTTAAEQAQYVGIIGSRRIGELTIKNCHFNGSITAKVGSVALIPYTPANVDVINTINNVTLVKGGSNYRAAMTFAHANTFGGGTSFVNTYSVGSDLIQFTNGSDKTDGTTTFASSAEMQNYYNTTYGAATVKEAAYKATKGANGEVYYTIKDGELAFGTATDRVFKVELTGDYKAVGYYLPGEVVDLYALGLPQYADTTFSGANVVDGKVTMGTADITITVAYGDSQKAGALEDLNELIALYEQYDQDLLDASSTVAAWLAAANAAKEADSYAAIRAQVIAAEAIVIKLADGVKPAFADFDLYAEYNTANNWTVATAADWLKAVSLGTDAKVLSANIYIIDDVDFGAGSAPFAPLGYGGTFKGNIYGGGHTLKNVNIQASAVTGTAPIALISQMGGNGTITEIGITGTVNGDGTADEHSFTAGLVGVVSGGAIKMIKVWNGATVTGDKATYAYAAGILGNSSNTDGLIINGAYNVGTVTSKGAHSTAENCAGAIIASGTSHYADALVTMFNAGTINKNGSTAGAAVLFRVNKGVTKVVRNTASTNVTVASYGDLAGIFEDTTVVANGYETGEIGYILNSYYTSDAGANFVDETGTALEKVYFSFDAEGKIVFGTEATQIRKITYSGVAEGTIYVNQGAKVPFANIAGASADYKVNGELVDINTYVMPANDVVMTVEAQYDVEAYNAAKAGLDALLAEYKGYNLDLFENGDAMQTLINDVEWLYEDEDINGIIDKWADVSETPIELALKEGKYVPYSKKAAYAKVDDGTKYGIYDENDWAAMVAAGNNSGKTVYLMNSITLTAAETALINQWSGTFEGQGFTVSGIAITKTSGGKAGLFLTNAGTIKNLTLDGTMNVTFGSADAYVENPYVGMFGAAGGTVIGCTNSVDITVTAYAAAKNNCCIGTINGYLGSVTNSINEGTLNVTLYSAGSATRPMIGGIVGRTRSVTSGNTNNGAITVNLFGADGSVFIGGIGSDSVGADFSNSVNNGSITVNGGQRIYLGGISSDTDSVGSLANTRNNGDLTVTCRTGDNVRIVRVGGISSNALPANDAETPYTNTGDITVDAAGSNQVYVFGIAPTNTEGVVATNSGAIYVGGMKEADSTHSAGNTTSSADQTNVTICVHEDRVYTHNADTKTHTMTCADCSHYEVLDCSGDWTYGAKEDFQIDGTTVNSTHSMTCDLCEEVYDEACVGTLVTNPADCTHGTIAKFNHGCGREDVIMVAGCEDHVFTGEFTTEGAAAGYEHRKCDCADCEVYESRLVDITFSTDCAGFVPGGDATVTLTMATGKLNAGTFTVSVGEGFTVKSVNGVEGNTLTLAEAMSAGDSFDIVVTAGATTYANGEVTIAISEAKNAADEDVIFENIVATVAINVTPGDANGDTKVDLIDAIIALREVAGVNDPGVCNVANAEMDGVPGISADDAVLIVRKWLKNV